MSQIVVYHSGYGCETGCCGHLVELDGKRQDFLLMDHPDDEETALEYAQRVVTESFGEEHIADLDWEHCIVVRSEDCYN